MGPKPQKTARIVAERGAFPDTLGACWLCRASGSTPPAPSPPAAFGAREAAVDGNVIRIFTRLTDCRDIADPEVKRSVRDALGQ